jgi:hypothetical protein
MRTGTLGSSSCASSTSHGYILDDGGEQADGMGLLIGCAGIE